jgi:hypothetical protein
MIRHTPHRRKRVQQFFYCRWYIPSAGMCLPSRCLATMGVHTDRQQRNLISLLLFFQNKERMIKKLVFQLNLH